MMNAGKQTFADSTFGNMLNHKGVPFVLALLALSLPLAAACSSGDNSCEGTGKRVCLIPFGNFSGDLIGQLVDHYQDQYALQVQVLDEESIPLEVIDPERDQVGAVALIEHMETLFPKEYSDPDAIIIGLTPVDMYTEAQDWRFAFWTSNIRINKSVVSSARMNPESFGLEADDDLLYTRVRKVVTRIIGTLYFDLPESNDPRSVLYNNVLSLADLDRMGVDLPTDVGGSAGER
jgi:predicted Zn-dependent protease